MKVNDGWVKHWARPNVYQQNAYKGVCAHCACALQRSVWKHTSLLRLCQCCVFSMSMLRSLHRFTRRNHIEPTKKNVTCVILLRKAGPGMGAWYLYQRVPVQSCTKKKPSRARITFYSLLDFIITKANTSLEPRHELTRTTSWFFFRPPFCLSSD